MNKRQIHNMTQVLWLDSGLHGGGTNTAIIASSNTFFNPFCKQHYAPSLLFTSR